MSSSNFKGDNLPVERVIWSDTQEFISRLNAMNDGYRYRLPTEAEWEYAARARGTAAGTTNLGEIAWYSDNSGDRTRPVGQKRPNTWGLYDMHGNVWEWVQDWYGNYSAGVQTDPSGPASGTYRVVRGGSWSDVSWVLRVSNRLNLSVPGVRNTDDAGLRLVRAVIP